MSADDPVPRLIWATRGKSWGFRFLRSGGLDDPLHAYEAAFDGVGGSTEALQQTGMTTALRFPDPEGRRDAAGRVIPHEFVLFAPLSGSIDSVESGVGLVWPLVGEEFANIWDQPRE